jgi:glycosyltransferase involved in cell wall biosynthesis
MPSGRSRPFRIGIWCDYGFTLTRLGGIGVFVYNLVEGLFALDEPIEVVMLVHQGDQHVTDCLQASARGRLQVVPAPLLRPNPLAVWMDKVALQGILLLDRLTLIRERLRNRFKDTVLALARRALRGNILLVAMLLVGLPVASALVWMVYALFQFAASAGLILRLPFKIVCDEIRKLGKQTVVPPCLPEDIAKAAHCDVWLIPYIIPYPLPTPSVLLIHDLVTYHYPEGLDSTLVRKVARLAPARAAEATLCGCMSAFIRDKDLLGTLALSPSKVRMVPFAAPRDFPNVTDERAALLRPAFLVRPYIFFPSGIRGYKNQRILVEALRELRDRHNENGFDLVLTGEIPNEMPKDLEELIDRLGLRQQVHILGPVDRETLGALFHCAFAVIVPSLYEQGSFPIYEGLHFGCPVACSDIPPLREQCAPMGDAMLYFDPRDPDAVARTIIMIRDHREEIRSRQHQTSRVMWQRTWQDVAREWLAVLKEAVELNIPSASHKSPPLAPWPHQEIQPSTFGPRPEVLLFLQTAYLGGVWEATRPLVQELAKINKQRGQLALTLAVHADQTGLGKLEVPSEELKIEEIRVDSFTRLELKDQLGILPSWSFDLGHRFSYLRGAMPAALRADAWFAFGDRFPAPLLPVRPYGLIIFDLLPTRFPEMFSPVFRRMVAEGMKPTAQAARLIIVTTTQARDDVQAMYGIEPSRIRLIPRACEPHRRFQSLCADPIDVLRTPLILNVTNASAHKGADVLLRAMAHLKHRVGGSPPNLVICGYNTEKFSANCSSPDELPYPSTIRQLVVKLGLVEGRDLAFLGYVSNEQLRFLHEQCSVLVNAARYDDGSFSMIEGAYFGQRVISSRYPAAEYLCERFGVPAKFFSPDDASTLAGLLDQSVAEKRIAGAELEQMRATLASEEFGYRRFAERLYECLVELAELGRRERLLKKTPASIRPAA